MKVSISTTVDAPLERVWQAWTTPAEITMWNFASSEWRCPQAALDLRPGGSFNYRMEAKDDSMGFDFCGEFVNITPQKKIESKLGDGRRVEVAFQEIEKGVKVMQSFEIEDENSAEQQRQGWQSILNNFKAHVEGNDVQSAGKS